MACLSVIRNYGDNKDKTAVDIELCSEDIPSLIHASPFIANEETTLILVYTAWHGRSVKFNEETINKDMYTGHLDN